MDSSPLPVRISMNTGNLELAFDLQRLPTHGVGLARLEFIIARMIGVHPKAILDYPNLPDDLKQIIEKHCAAYRDPVHYYVNKLSESIAAIAASFVPEPVIVRLSDIKRRQTNKYIGVYGQGPSDHPNFASWLVKTGIESLSLNPDSMVQTWLSLAKNGK